VTAFYRRLFSAVAVVGLVGVTGCGPDNEGEAKKLEAKAGDPGKPNPDSVRKDVPPIPTSSEERAKRGPSDPTKGAVGYPGGSSKK